MIRHLLLLTANVAILAGGLTGVALAEGPPLLGVDGCESEQLVTVDGHVAAQPFGFVDLVRGSWEGDEVLMIGVVDVATPLPDEATEATGDLRYRIVFDVPEHKRVLEATLGTNGWSGHVHEGGSEQRLVTDDVEVEADGKQVTITAPASAFTGLPASDIDWRVVVDAPDARTPATLPVHRDLCEANWVIGDTAPDQLPEPTSRKVQSIFDARNEHVEVAWLANCHAIAAAWVTTIDANLPKVLKAKDGRAVSRTLPPREALIVETVQRNKVARDCEDLPATALEHLQAAGQAPSFTFDTDEIADLDCRQVKTVRKELASFDYESTADYLAALRVATALERERNRSRCGDPDDVVAMPGADVAPGRWPGTPTTFDRVVAGECFDAVKEDHQLVDPVSVPCDQPHDFQAFAAHKGRSDNAFGTWRWYEDMVEDCFDEGLLKRFLTDKELEHIFVEPLTPTEFGWNLGDRTVLCVINDFEGFKLVGDIVEIPSDATST